MPDSSKLPDFDMSSMGGGFGGGMDFSKFQGGNKDSDDDDSDGRAPGGEGADEDDDLPDLDEPLPKGEAVAEEAETAEQAQAS